MDILVDLNKYGYVWINTYGFLYPQSLNKITKIHFNFILGDKASYSILLVLVELFLVLCLDNRGFSL